jgi:release factor glutamine methyltransferase
LEYEALVMTSDVLAGATTLPRHEAERLLMAAGSWSRSELVADRDVDPEAMSRFRDLVARRVDGTPLQYLEGSVQFGPVELLVDRRALVPRPETEVLWEDAVQSLDSAGPGTVIVDLCTGSGNLALALKHAFPEAQVYGTDNDEDALALASENAGLTGLDVTFLKGDLFEALPRKLMGRIDLLVTNPPYVAAGEVSSLPDEVREHEPVGALVAGERGTEVIERIAEEAFWWLGIGGWLFCEIGETHRDQAFTLFGALDREIRRDLAGKDRYVAARRGASCCV